MPKVLLTTLNAKYIHTNLAIRLLYEMNQDFPGIDWKEFTIKENKTEISDYCSNFDIVAFSCYIWNITQTLEVAEKIKRTNPSIKILLGGPEVSYEFENIISLSFIDFIIYGEGEIPFRQFINSFPIIDNVESLIWKELDVVKKNNASTVFDLKQLEQSMPYGFDDIAELKNKVLYIETSRGCPYKCEFCLASLDNKVRYLPDSSIKKTLLFLMEHGRVIKFLDRTFNIKRDFTLDIFQFILDNHKPENVFQFEITADILHPDIIQFILENVPKGLFRFEIGIQSVNQQANLAVSRKQNFEKTKKIIQQLRSKVEMHLDLIVGLPLDYWEETKFSFEEVFKLFAPELQLGFLKFLKGTPVREKHLESGYQFDTDPPYQIIKSNFLTQNELKLIQGLEHVLEIYWNNKRALNTLKYVTLNYSIFDFLVQLGQSFSNQLPAYGYSIDDIFLLLNRFAESNYTNDVQLKELIAIDYYLHFKVKPKPLLIQELGRIEKYQFIETKKLNHHKYRFVILPLEYNFQHFLKTNQNLKSPNLLVIKYNGKDKAEFVMND